MPTVINTNLASLFAQNSLSGAQNSLATSVQRLSSGLRINSAKDDAAGLAIAQNMQSQINGTNQSVQNLNDATNLLQTADSSLSTIQDMLLNLKQLATQGYDGSLNASQKLDIVQQMKDLNTEINATASRTQFNGIQLLASGSTIDAQNSDIKAGEDITATAFSYSTSTSGGMAQTGALTGTAGNYTVSLNNSSIDSLAGNTYSFSSSGNTVTLTGTINGLATSQTVTVQDALPTASSTNNITYQTLSFSNFGVSVALATADNLANAATITGTTIASAFNTMSTLAFNGNIGTISDVRLQGTGPGSYTITGNTNTGALTMSGTINSIAVTQTITLSDISANTTSTLNFSSFGVQMDVKAYGHPLSATGLASMIPALNPGTPSTTGQVVVSSGANSDLQFQSGPASNAFVDIYTLNVQTGTSGEYAGTATQMTTLGNRITGTSTGNLGALSSNDTISTWQTAFQNAAAAADNAIDYISTQRATYGSQMNRLSYVSTNLQTQSTNLSQSRSAIIDTNFASETANLTKGQIMQQAATAMLAQANQMPNVILSLLK